MKSDTSRNKQYYFHFILQCYDKFYCKWFDQASLLVVFVLLQGRIQEGRRTRRPHPPSKIGKKNTRNTPNTSAIGKKYDFLAWNRNFSHEIPQNFSRLPPLGAIFLSAPPPPDWLEILDPPCTRSLVFCVTTLKTKDYETRTHLKTEVASNALEYYAVPFPLVSPTHIHLHWEPVENETLRQGRWFQFSHCEFFPFTCWYIAAAPVYGVYLSQLIRYSNLYMEYIFLSWYGIPVVVVPIMIFLIEVFFYNEATKTRVHNC